MCWFAPSAHAIACALPALDVHTFAIDVQTVVTQPKPPVSPPRLEELAKMTRGHVTTIAREPDWEPDTFGALVGNAELIVLARVVGNTGRVALGGHDIYTCYQLDVREALKGDARSAEEPVVLIPGGRVAFADGSWAQVNSPGFVRPVSEQDYVWFLKAASATVENQYDLGPDVFVPDAGALGVYRLGSTGVQPSGALRSALATEIRSWRPDHATFVNRIKVLAAPVQ